MKHLIITVILLTQYNVFGSRSDGTPTRLEQEYKISFENNDEIDSVFNIIQRSLFNLVSSEKLVSGKQLNEEYFLTGREIPFVFIDFYFDTKDYDLNKKGAIYRLRYRWKTLDDFIGFGKKPRNSVFPIRAEIQSKTNIKITEDSLVSSQEARFEFRNDSAPFNILRNAPPAPWPLAEYLAYTKNGFFRQYEIFPGKEIKNIGVTPRDTQPVFIVKTERRRLHFNLITPWGSGPNPTQAFIITLDKFSYKPYKNVFDSFQNNFSHSEYEIEIEFERNTSTNLFKDKSSKEFVSLFFRDQRTIKDTIVGSLVENDIKLNKKNVNKFRRVLMKEGIVK